MSLGIVVLTEEGVVIAAESLGTLLSQEQSELQSECKKCGQKGKPNLSCAKCGDALGPAPTLSRQFPVTHTFHCQKLFRINNYTGAIIVGNPSFGAMKAQHAVYAFINWLVEKGKDDNYAEEMVANWQSFCVEANVLEKHVGPTEIVFAGIKNKTSPCPFSQTMAINKGSISLGSINVKGIVAAGVHEILDKMFEGGGIRQYPVNDFPLQDAVEFAEFLMQTQIGIDKYTARLPRVGGEIDLAIVHPNHGFAWVRQKELQRIMEAPTK
jgi:hypothetical protein